MFLKSIGLLTHPVLYISYYLKKNRIEYYDRLDEVRKKGNYEQWVKFFLQAVIATCEDSIHTIEELSALRSKNLKAIPQTKIAKNLFEYIERNPIIDIKKTALELGVSYNGLAKTVTGFVQKSILKEKTSAKRNRVFYYDDYLEILKKDTDNLCYS